MQNMCVIWNAGIGHKLRSIRAHVLEMSGSGGSRKGVGLKKRYSVPVPENSITKAEL